MSDGRKGPEHRLVVSVDEALRETSLGLLRFLDAEAERKGWRCGQKQRRQMYLHWLDAEQPTEMPAASLFTAMDVVGHGRFLDELFAYEQRIGRQRRIERADEDRVRMPGVRAGR